MKREMCKEARWMLRAGLFLSGGFLLYIFATLLAVEEIGSYGCFVKQIKAHLEVAFLLGLIPAYGAAVIEIIKKEER